MIFPNLRQTKFPLIVVGISLTAFTSCSNRPDPDLPFDRNGNYVEAWDKDGTFAFEEPEAPDFYEPESSSTKKKIASTKPKSSSKPKTYPKSKPKPKPKRKVTPSYKTHIVKKGETLYRLSRKYNTSVSKLRSINGISGNLIRIGQRIKVPR